LETLKPEDSAVLSDGSSPVVSDLVSAISLLTATAPNAWPAAIQVEGPLSEDLRGLLADAVAVCLEKPDLAPAAHGKPRFIPLTQATPGTASDPERASFGGSLDEGAPLPSFTSPAVTTPPPGSENDQPILDEDAFGDLVSDIGVEGLTRMLGRFFPEAEGRVRLLGDRTADRQIKEAAAHTLKGNSSNLGLPRLSRLAAGAMIALRAGEDARAADFIIDLPAALEASRRVTAEYLAKSSA